MLALMITILIILAVTAVIIYLIEIAPFGDSFVKAIARWIIIVIAVVWLLYTLLPLAGVNVGTL